VLCRGRSTTALVVAAALTIPLVGGGARAGADSDDDAVERAAAEIAAAKQRANDAAAAYFDALSELDQLEDEAKRLTREAAVLEQQVDALREQVEQVAVNRFVSSGHAGIPALSGMRDPTEQLQAEVLVSVVTDSSAEAMDEFERAELQLEDNQQAVAENQAQIEVKRDQYLELKEQAEAEVIHLQEAEQQRLRDERIREALEARQREEQRQRELEAKRLAQEAAERAAEEAETQNTAVPPAPAPEPEQGGGDVRPRSDESSDEDESEPPPTAPQPEPEPEPLPAAPEPQPELQPLPAAPEPQPEPEPAPPPTPSSGMVCPVAGASSYSDTYGAPRSGGRSHEGVDLIAPAGTPLVAVVSGNAEFRSTSLGGNSVGLSGDDGNYYFYAHLSAYEGSSRHVAQGEVIGYVGETGNTDINHLHFEIHPGGGSSVNPYPYVVNAGC
jgi:murein DD-endopeptidase MepM/ murein hydrolase activator NlpD